MSIRGNIGIGSVSIAAADTTIYDPPSTVERYAISAFSVHNTTAAAVTVSVYNSPDLTSAAGVRNAFYSIPANQSVDIVELIGQGFLSSRNIIAVGGAVGLRATMSVTTYDGGD
jgi:hypothetical protein